MSVARSILLFAVAALFEIGGAWLVWQGVREQRGWIWAGLGVIALGAYGFVATFQDDGGFNRPGEDFAEYAVGVQCIDAHRRP